jgi:hypothetical protein
MRRWSVLIHERTIWGKIREKLYGTYLELECDEVAHGPPGFFELIYNDSNSAEYLWFQDVKSWRCNFEHREIQEELNNRHSNAIMQDMQNMISDTKSNGPPPEGAYQ